MIKLYKFLSQIAAPFLKMYFYARCYYGKDDPNNVCNHFGEPTAERPGGHLIWIHAASIGEANSALTYIKHLHKTHKDLHVLLTTITLTSAKLLEKKNQELFIHQFVVADNPNWIKKFLNYWQPEKAIFLESEIWPNTICELSNRNIPIFLLNARLSPRSFKRWSYLKSILAELLKKFTAILAQSELDAERFSFFSPKNTYKIDNLKYANELLPCNTELLKFLQKICAEKKVLVAVSTHSGEEEAILQAHEILKRFFDIVTIIIPRHLTRMKEIEELIQKHQLKYVLRSVLQENSEAEIICIDTFGEAGTCFRIADVVFVGGSLVPIGGHNPYEPAAFAKPVLFGPHMENALEIRDLLINNHAGFEVKSAQDIAHQTGKFFSNPELFHPLKNITRNEALKQIDEIVKF